MRGTSAGNVSNSRRLLFALAAVSGTLAQKACASLQPGGAPPRITEGQLEQMAAKARCIRQHGFPSFPDPTLAAGGLGVDYSLPPDWNIEAPAVITAREACAHIGIAIPGAGVSWFGPIS